LLDGDHVARVGHIDEWHLDSRQVPMQK
jgi:hypothetical protein